MMSHSLRLEQLFRSSVNTSLSLFNKTKPSKAESFYDCNDRICESVTLDLVSVIQVGQGLLTEKISEIFVGDLELKRLVFRFKSDP